MNKKHKEIVEYFHKSQNLESTLPIFIERAWIRHEREVRGKREIEPEDDEEDERTKREIGRSRRPDKIVFVVRSAGKEQIVQYVYVVCSLIGSIGFLAWSIPGMLKSATTVIVTNVHDTRKPPRELPTTLAMFFRSKKQQKTPTETTPPEMPKVGTKEAAK
ncbi:unnamed protein product [Caenorhabditis sp. 36 PRJEB53466]|nr:unnamed protein product [Caenorhabditis sp. 36 PRJEB53466]